MFTGAWRYEFSDSIGAYFISWMKLIMKNLQNYLLERKYLYGMCQMTGYMPENEDLFYKLDGDNIKDLFQKNKELWKQDKKAFIKAYKYITELEIFINWKWWMYNEYPEISDEKNNWNTFGKIWEKMHDFNCSKFKYETEEWKYYFNSID